MGVWFPPQTPSDSESSKGTIDVAVSVEAIEVRAASGASSDPTFGSSIPLSGSFEPIRVLIGTAPWQRFAFRFNSEDRALVGAALCVALKPYALRCFGWAPFRGPSRHGKPALTESAPRDGSWTAGATGAIRNDPFETQRAATASLEEPGPRRSQWEDDARIGRERGARGLRPLAYAFGATSDRDATLNALKSARGYEELIDRTTRRTLRFNFGGVAANVRIYEELIPECLSLLEESAQQALAGPFERDTSSWIGVPVLRLVERIYKEHVNNLNRRYRAQQMPGLTDTAPESPEEDPIES